MARKKSTDPPATERPPGEPAEFQPDANGQAKKRPVVSFRCASSRDTYIEVSVYENEVRPASGEPFKQYVTTVNRSYYKDGDGWQTPERPGFRTHDLPILQHRLARAHAWATDQRVIENVPIA